MRRSLRVLLVIGLWVSPAFAQSPTVGLFAATVADANATTPVAAPKSYTPLCNIAPKRGETLPITDPTDGSRPLTFCNGTTSPITGWALYTNGVRSLLGTVTAGTTNAAALRLYTATITVPVGITTYEVAAVNQTTEGQKSPLLTFTATAPIVTPGPTTNTRLP
jgi:hypothetical protein